SKLPLLASLADRRQRLAASRGDSAEGAEGAGAEEGKDRRTRKSDKKTLRAKYGKKEKAKKGAPQEVSSRRVSAPPQAAAAQAGARAGAMRVRDPRFDDVSGKLDMDGFGKSYSFLEEYREQELENLKGEQQKLDRLQKKGPKRADVVAAIAERKDEVKQEIRKRIQQDKSRRHMGVLLETERELKGQEREKVRTTGKTPFYHKKGLVRKIVLEKKKEAQGGGRNKDAERREKKVAGREKKRLPARRRHCGTLLRRTNNHCAERQTVNRGSPFFSFLVVLFLSS
ncbi:unnamed protein product, partial [Polarella glacialis]